MIQFERASCIHYFTFTPTISRDSLQNSRLHTGTRVNFVLSTYLLTYLQLHYFTMPLTPEVTSGASIKVIFDIHRRVFSCFLKVSAFASSWRLDRRVFHAFGPAYEKLLSPSLSFSCGVSYQKLLVCECESLMAGQIGGGCARLSSCWPGKKDCDRCAQDA